jgi:hypothetical protein
VVKDGENVFLHSKYKCEIYYIQQSYSVKVNHGEKSLSGVANDVGSYSNIVSEASSCSGLLKLTMRL